MSPVTGAVQDQVRVLLTGAGGVAFPYLVKSLRGFKVVAVDMDEFAVGLYLADKGYVIPPGDSPAWGSAVSKICRDEKIDIVVPLVDEELLPALELQGVSVLLPRREFVQTCLDKYRLMRVLDTAPKTILASENHSFGFPVIVKPRRGHGSKGVSLARTEQELSHALENVDPAATLIQEYIEGEEYTVSVVLWRDGEIQAVVPKEIICKRGVTRLAVTKRNKQIDKLCFDIQGKLKADGPFNLQLKIDKNGNPRPFEINPRFSTTATLTIAAGVNEVGGLITQALGDGGRISNQWSEGLVMIRQTADKFISADVFKEKQAGGTLCSI